MDSLLKVESHNNVVFYCVEMRLSISINRCYLQFHRLDKYWSYPNQANFNGISAQAEH